MTEVPGPVNRGPGGRDSLGHNIASFQETAGAAVRLCVLSHSLFLLVESVNDKRHLKLYPQTRLFMKRNFRVQGHTEVPDFLKVLEGLQTKSWSKPRWSVPGPIAPAGLEPAVFTFGG